VSKLNLNSPAVHRASGFTLIELLIVIAVVGALAALLFPGLGRAKQQGQMVRCLSNFHQIGLGTLMYSADNHNRFPPGDSQQLDPNASTRMSLGNALGGGDPQPPNPFYPVATNRLLNPYIPTRETWHCSADRGLQLATDNITPSLYEVLGSSYRFNWHLQDNYQNLRVAEDPYYNLAGKKEDWVPEPFRFIMFHEMATYPWCSATTGEVPQIAQWHNSASPGKGFSPSNLKTAVDKFLGPILFVDGHCQACDFTSVFRPSPWRALEATKDWMWYKPLR
jgi:prepilin-type N-terminal cleavage/methylation domain-containing protein